MEILGYEKFHTLIHDHCRLLRNPKKTRVAAPIPITVRTTAPDTLITRLRISRLSMTSLFIIIYTAGGIIHTISIVLQIAVIVFTCQPSMHASEFFVIYCNQIYHFHF
jgi:hypothetical protein